MKSKKPDGRPNGSTGRELSLVIDFWVGSAFVVAMALCAAVEYMRNPDVPLAELMPHHIIELLLYGFVLWGITWLVLRMVLIGPMEKIFQHLYRIGGGDHSPLVVKTGVREIRSIVDGINLMLWRMEQQVDRKAVKNARQKVSVLREHISGCEGIDADRLSSLLDQVSNLEKKLYEVGYTRAIKMETAKHKYWGFPNLS